MSGEAYTPGNSSTAVSFMAARSADTHAAFVLPHLRAGMRLLDCGCGPGQITVDLAEVVAPGAVTGVDASDAQFARGLAEARRRGVPVELRQASVYELPFPDASFDVVFAHALLEHLSEPVAAIREMSRVLTPGGLVGVCSPDWGGFIVTPPGPRVDAAISAYVRLQQRNGGDPYAGRRLSSWLLEAGVQDIEGDARYERYADPRVIADYLSEHLRDAGQGPAARDLSDWARAPAAMFAQTWVSAIGRRPRSS